VDDATFLAGLALSSLNRGRPALRGGSLARCTQLVERAVTAGKIPVSHLAALERLRLADLASSGEDPLPPLSQEVARCFTGELPLAYAQWLLEGWKGAWWTCGNQARLRVLLCDQAFEAGLELSDLIQAAGQVPPLAAVLDLENSERLAQLRLLWSLRATCPWAQWGRISTVFELAGSRSSESLLKTSPDLLLADRGTPAIHMLGSGILFQDVLFKDEPHELGVQTVRDSANDFQVIIDDQKFRFSDDPAGVAKQLERWFRFFFRDFAGRVQEVYSWKSPTGGLPISPHAAVSCPSCRCRVVPIIGQVALMREGSNPLSSNLLDSPAADSSLP
jgi:hypothetical protein